jgi:hypothetical protein
MRKLITKKTDEKGGVARFASKSSAKSVRESQFWKKIALEQQMLLHAKNNT